MYNFDNKFQSFVYAVVTNKELSEDERSKIIADFFEEFRESYPNLEHAVTKHELTESELRLTKEIKELDVKIEETKTELTKEIRELDVKLTREIKELDVKIEQTKSELTKEIETTRKDIANSKSDTIKWVAGMLFVQVIAIGGLFLTAFKLFSVSN